jgi:hypothetical protein
MTGVKEKLADGTVIDADGVIIESNMQIAEFNGDSVSDNHVFEYRFNCQDGKAFLGDSKKRVVSAENEAETHELIFTLVAFQKITPPDGYAMLSAKYGKIREWGQVIGIDSNGLVFSTFVKTYALGGFNSLIEGFIYDVQTKKETGSLIGRLVKFDFGKQIKDTQGAYFMPSVLFLKDVSPFADKAKQLIELRKTGGFVFPKPNLVRV